MMDFSNSFKMAVEIQAAQVGRASQAMANERAVFLVSKDPTKSKGQAVKVYVTATALEILRNDPGIKILTSYRVA